MAKLLLALGRGDLAAGQPAPAAQASESGLRGELAATKRGLASLRLGSWTRSAPCARTEASLSASSTVAGVRTLEHGRTGRRPTYSREWPPATARNELRRYRAQKYVYVRRSRAREHSLMLK